MLTDRFAGQSGVTIDYETSEDLPPVEADPDQLKQIFLNLVTNAVQVMEDGGGAITVKAEAHEGYVSITVTDTGPGIPTEDVGKVFDPFFSTRDAGTGLGLTIVHRIIDEHHGHIEVESGPGGTMFRVSLPVVVGVLEEVEWDGTRSAQSEERR